MFRAIFPRVMWVGRAAVFTVGLAVILAVVFGVASMAFAANGDPWILGQPNTATAITKLAGAAGVNGPMLQLINNDADTNDTALSLVVEDGEPPMKVTSDTRVVNLNSDKLDNKDSAAFLPSEIYEKSVTQTLSAGSVDNADDTTGGSIKVIVYCADRPPLHPPPRP